MYANVLSSISVTKRLFIFGQTLGNSKCNRDRHIKLGKKFGFFENEKSWARMIWSFRIWKNIANRTTFGRDTEGFRSRSTPLLLLLLLLLHIVSLCTRFVHDFPQWFVYHILTILVEPKAVPYCSGPIPRTEDMVRGWNDTMWYLRISCAGVCVHVIERTRAYWWPPLGT